MRTRARSAAVLLPGLLASCAGAAGGPPDADAALGGPVRYEMRSLERTAGGCPEEPRGVCAEVELEYPEIEAAPTREAEERLRDAVGTFLLAPAPFVDRPAGAEELAREFLAHQAEVRRSYPEGSSSSGWFFERRIAVLHQDGRVFSLDVSERWYSGGVHPNSSASLASFDPRTGRRLLLDDLVERARVPDLVDLAERRFREVRGIPRGVLLSEAGFTFPQETFYVNDDFAVTPEGLAFHFDPYEVGPYALGPTDYVVSRAELASLARADGPLASTP